MSRNNYPPAYQSWLALCLGIAFYFSGFFHRMVTAVMADQLMADFNIGAASLGNFSSFYYYSYVAVQIPTGILADYWGPRKLLTAGAALSSVGAFIFAASSWNGFISSRALARRPVKSTVHEYRLSPSGVPLDCNIWA